MDSSTKSPPPAQVVIDKNKTSVTLGVAAALVLAYSWNAVAINDMQNGIANNGKAIEEVKVQVAKIGEAVTGHARDIIRLQERSREYDKRLQALEKEK